MLRGERTPRVDDVIPGGDKVFKVEHGDEVAPRAGDSRYSQPVPVQKIAVVELQFVADRSG